MRDYQDFGLDGLGALWVSKHLDSAQTFAFYPKVSKTMCLDFTFAAAKSVGIVGRVGGGMLSS